MTRLALTPTGQAGRLRWLPFIAAIATLATAAPLAWSKGFDTFLFVGAFYLPAVAFVCVAFSIWAIVERKTPRGRSIFAALLVVVALTAATFYGLPRFKDEIRFLIWSQTHGDVLRAFANKDAIVLDWESWGMAGMENASYLVSNPGDNLGETGAVSEWARHAGSSCDIVGVKRLARGFYLLTTSNCPLR